MRYAACLRKAGHTASALTVSRRLVRQTPADPRAAELGWASWKPWQVRPRPHDLRRLEAIADEALRDGQGSAVAEIVLTVVEEALHQPSGIPPTPGATVWNRRSSMGRRPSRMGSAGLHPRTVVFGQGARSCTCTAGITPVRWPYRR
ncbi:MAG: hypothetical protein HZY76_14865 [Anaerolineae bacterium]|nr:MAG: hypothetical protein HZY76_14865 [Anaerolineae bacterium]